MGYIGLPSAAMFATHGWRVTGVDIDPETVRVLNRGDVHIAEPGLQAAVRAAVLSDNLVVAEQPRPADAFILAVPTPLVMESGEQGRCGARHLVPHAKMAHVRAATESVVPFLRKGNLVILESTSPPGTTANTVVPLLERSGLKVGRDLYVAHCPERVLPGRILEELVTNDRVIGGITPESAERAEELYSAFVEGSIFLTDATTAELVKLMENTYRDVNIALANELALVAEKLGINIWDAITIANRHPRVNIHRPGPGVGGHCIAVDPWFMAAADPEGTRLIQTARKVNDSMPLHVMELVRRATQGIRRPVVACLGIAYKANVGDIRESPAVAAIRLMEDAGFMVRAYDPHVSEADALSIKSRVISMREAVRGADCIVILTDHCEFRGLDPKTLSGFCGRSVVDTRNVLPVEVWMAAGIDVRVLGAAASLSGV
jgi:UDP-N-acetyl-D-mannosaminuronic acid dehydrogenase